MIRTIRKKNYLKKINEIPKWFHSIPLGTRIKTPGVYNQKFYEFILKDIPNDLSGKTVLDVGTRNGLYAFECERRNAKEIIAIDNWQGKSSSYGRPFFICKEILDSNVKFIEMDFFDIKLDKKI